MNYFVWILNAKILLREKDYGCGKLLRKETLKESFMFWLKKWSYLITSFSSSTLLLDILSFHSHVLQSLFSLIICWIQQFHWLIIISNNLFRFGVLNFFQLQNGKKNFQYKEKKLLFLVKIFLSSEKFLKWRISLLLGSLLDGKFYWPNFCHYGFKTQSLAWT